MKIEIIEANVTTDKELIDRVGHESYSEYEVDGTFICNGKKGDFTYNDYREDSNGGTSISIHNEDAFSDEELAEIEDFILDEKGGAE